MFAMESDLLVSEVCASYATMVNKNDAIGTDEWRSKPLEQQMAWKIPLEIMIDIPHLRSRHPVLLTSEYLLLQGLDPEQEKSNGSWDRFIYHSGKQRPTLYVIPNWVYEPDDQVRVDSWSGTGEVMPPRSAVGKHYDDLLLARVNSDSRRQMLDWTDAQVVVYQTGVAKTEEEVLEALEEAGWSVVHTWDGA